MICRRLLIVAALFAGAIVGVPAGSVSAAVDDPDPDHPFSDPVWFPLREPARVSCAKTNCAGPYHGFDAVDWLGDLGDPIYAAGAGILHIGDVDPSCPADRTTFGTWVWVDHGPAGISRYTHLDSITAVEGQLVTPGTQIGTMGHSGAQAPCLTNYTHFEIRTDQSIDSRLPIPNMRACVVGGSEVQLPPSMGFPTWDDVPPQIHFTPQSDESCMPSTWPKTPTKPTASVQPGVEQITVTPSARPAGVDAVRVRLELFHPSLGDYGARVEQDISPMQATATFNDLLSGRTYRAMVSFHNSAGWSAWSNPLTAVPGVIPTAPEFRYLTSTHTTIGYGWFVGLNGDADYRVAIRQAHGSTWGAWTYHPVPSPDLHYRFRDLLRGTKYQVTVRAENEYGTSEWAPRHVITTLGCEGVCVEQPRVFTPLVPARFADSRNQPTFDNAHRNTGPRRGGTTWEIPIASRGDVPTTATAAVVNLTALNSVGPGFATVYPCGQRPTASSVNYVPGAIEPNEVIAKLSPSGTICVYTTTDVDVIVDVAGHVTNSPYQPLSPTRFADSRNEPTFDNAHRNTGRRQGGTTWEIPIAGRGAVPAWAKTATVNVTVTGGTGPGYATVYPCGALPVASSLNYDVGITRPNELVTKLSATGGLCIYTSTSAHLIVDVVGYAGDVVGFNPLAPVRLADSRNQPTIDGQQRNTGRRTGGTTWEIPIEGRGDILNADAVVANVTVTGAPAPGYVTIYDCGTLPTASSLNYFLGTTRPNETIAKLSASGTLCIYTSTSAHLIVDVVGFTDD